MCVWLLFDNSCSWLCISTCLVAYLHKTHINWTNAFVPHYLQLISVILCGKNKMGRFAFFSSYTVKWDSCGLWQWNASKNACWGAKILLSKLFLARMSSPVFLYHVVWPIFHSWNTVRQQNVLLHTSSPHSLLLVDPSRIRWSFLLGLGRTGLLIWSSLFLVTMLRFTGRRAHRKELHRLRCLSCASAKAPITLLVSWCS